MDTFIGFVLSLNIEDPRLGLKKLWQLTFGTRIQYHHEGSFSIIFRKICPGSWISSALIWQTIHKQYTSHQLARLDAAEAMNWLPWLICYCLYNVAAQHSRAWPQLSHFIRRDRNIFCETSLSSIWTLHWTGSNFNTYFGWGGKFCPKKLQLPELYNLILHYLVCLFFAIWTFGF